MSETVLVTGSSTGFGRRTTQRLIEAGYTVFATMREPEGRNAPRADELTAFAEGKPGALHLLELDVAHDASVDSAVARALQLEDRIDVVVNNAGYGVGGLTEAVTMAQFEQIFAVNVFGIQRLNRAVLPGMRARGSGLLVHVSSIMGRIVIPFSGPYTASKYALEGLAESYRYELSGTGIDVVIVEPGGFKTSFLSNMEMAEDDARVASYGALAEISEKMWDGFTETLQGDEAPDAQRVADAILGVIQTPAGKRPLRTVVDPLMGGQARLRRSIARRTRFRRNSCADWRWTTWRS